MYPLFLIGDCAYHAATECGRGDQCSNELILLLVVYLRVKEKKGKKDTVFLSDIPFLIRDLRKVQVTI